MLEGNFQGAEKRVASRPADRGADVAAGDVLVTIENAELLRQIDTVVELLHRRDIASSKRACPVVNLALQVGLGFCRSNRGAPRGNQAATGAGRAGRASYWRSSRGRKLAVLADDPPH